MSWSDPDTGSRAHLCERSVVSCEISFCKSLVFVYAARLRTTETFKSRLKSGIQPPCIKSFLSES